MASTQKVILLPRGAAGKICRAEGVGRTTLYDALKGATNSEQAKKLRKLALSTYGGVEWKKPIL